MSRNTLAEGGGHPHSLLYLCLLPDPFHTDPGQDVTLGFLSGKKSWPRHPFGLATEPTEVVFLNFALKHEPMTGGPLMIEDEAML